MSSGLSHVIAGVVLALGITACGGDGGPEVPEPSTDLTEVTAGPEGAYDWVGGSRAVTVTVMPVSDSLFDGYPFRAPTPSDSRTIRFSSDRHTVDVAVGSTATLPAGEYCAEALGARECGLQFWGDDAFSYSPGFVDVATNPVRPTYLGFEPTFEFQIASDDGPLHTGTEPYRGYMVPKPFTVEQIGYLAEWWVPEHSGRLGGNRGGFSGSRVPSVDPALELRVIRPHSWVPDPEIGCEMPTELVLYGESDITVDDLIDVIDSRSTEPAVRETVADLATPLASPIHTVSEIRLDDGDGLAVYAPPRSADRAYHLYVNGLIVPFDEWNDWTVELHRLNVTHETPSGEPAGGAWTVSRLDRELGRWAEVGVIGGPLRRCLGPRQQLRFPLGTGLDLPAGQYRVTKTVFEGREATQIVEFVTLGEPEDQAPGSDMCGGDPIDPDTLWAPPVPCTAVVRLDYQSHIAMGYQMFCGDPADVSLESAAARALADAGRGSVSESVELPEGLDHFLFYRSASDFGGVSVVSALTGLTTFGGSIVFDGQGGLTYPEVWSSAVELVSGCSFDLDGIPQAGVDLRDGSPIDDVDYATALDAAVGTGLAGSLHEMLAVTDVLVLLYPRSVGAFDPSSAEWVVMFNGTPRTD